MIQSVTFIIIRPRAPGCIPPSFRLFSLRLIRLLLAESVQKIFLTFVYSCSVSRIMESDSGILSRMIICKSPPWSCAFLVVCFPSWWTWLALQGERNVRNVCFYSFHAGHVADEKPVLHLDVLPSSFSQPPLRLHLHLLQSWKMRFPLFPLFEARAQW